MPLRNETANIRRRRGLARRATIHDARSAEVGAAFMTPVSPPR